MLQDVMKANHERIKWIAIRAAIFGEAKTRPSGRVKDWASRDAMVLTRRIVVSERLASLIVLTRTTKM
jgi:hypothetical protein